MIAHMRGYRWRKVSPDQAQAIRAAFLAGVNYRELATAYGVSSRTIYRIVDRASTEEYHVVHVAGYSAPFGIGDEGPVQLGPWVASRARAWDNVRDEYSVAIAHNAQRPVSRLYSEARGVDVPEYRRNE